VADSPAQRRDSEIDAYKKELDCLKKAMRASNWSSDDPALNCVCRPSNVDAFIHEVEQRLQNWENSNPNGPFNFPN
jgi:hypothetical protein